MPAPNCMRSPSNARPATANADALAPADHRPHPGHSPGRRRLLGCCAAAVGGLFTGLAGADQASARPAPVRTARWSSEVQDLVDRSLDGLDAAALWDVHTHLLGIGDSGSGCRVHPHLLQWWHPVETLRRRVILSAAGVPADAPAIDRAYVARLQALAADFPAGARWLLFAFDEAHDEAGRPQPDWTTFHVPDAYAAGVAAATPERFGWVASIHPYREDALQRLDQALAGGALALKWLPSAMAIDLRSPRLHAFYDKLAASRLPLIVHCGEEKAVPGAGREEFGNPLHARAALERGVRVVMAHCASLGQALDLDRPRPRPVPAFALFARLMDEPAWRDRLFGDISALFQVNRTPLAWRTVLAREDWQPRLLHGSDHPLPGIAPLYRLGRLVELGLLAEADVAALQALRRHNPLLFDLALKRSLRLRGAGLSRAVFETRGHFDRGSQPGARVVATVSPGATG